MIAGVEWGGVAESRKFGNLGYFPLTGAVGGSKMTNYFRGEAPNRIKNLPKFMRMKSIFPVDSPYVSLCACETNLLHLSHAFSIQPNPVPKKRRTPQGPYARGGRLRGRAALFWETPS